MKKIEFPPKDDRRADGHMDICNYRVASLLKINPIVKSTSNMHASILVKEGYGHKIMASLLLSMS